MITDTRLLFSLLIASVALMRLAELERSRRHENLLRARGAREVGRSHYRWMVVLHAVFLVAGPAEVWLLGRPFLPWLAATAGILFAAAMALRWWAIVSLGGRWTTRVMVLSGAPLVTSGPYRYLRHPNYLAVAVELIALPLIHTAWWTAIVCGAANLAVLAVRIRVEDAALRDAASPKARPTPG